MEMKGDKRGYVEERAEREEVEMKGNGYPIIALWKLNSMEGRKS